MKGRKRVSPKELSSRLVSLGTIYNQKNLANLLGISVRSLNYYQKGESFPKSDKVYKSINQLYNRSKHKLKQEKIEKRKKSIKKKSEAQKYGRIKWRTAPIYTDYMYDSPAEEFNGVKDWDKLEELSELGYVAGWIGRDIIPLEVQFLLAGENKSRFGKIVRIVGVVTRMNSPKLSNGWTGDETELTIFPTYYRLIGIKKEDDFSARLDKIREFFFKLEISKGYPLSLLGYYFDENDEL